MFKEVDVVLWVEHKDRELDSYKEIAKILKEKYNLSSIIISNFFHSYYLFLYRPKLVVWNNLTNNKGWPDGFIWEVYGKSIEYVSHRWEQLLSPVNFKFKAPQNDFEKEIVKLFVWDKEFKNYLLSYGVKKENIFIIGNIANNLLFNIKDKKEFFRDKLANEFSLDKNKEWLFLPMNYNWAFFSDEMVDSRIRSGYDKEIAIEYREYAKKSLREFILFIEKIKNFEIILRPHPSITEDDYKKVFNEILGYIPKNIILNKSYSIREWIIASDIIGSSWSTSVYDAYKIGKKSFYFTPFSRPEWMNTYWMDEVKNIKNYDEFLKFLNEDNNLDLKIENISLQNFAKQVYQLQKNKTPKPNYLKSIKYIKNLIKYFIKDKLCKYFNCFKVPKWQHYDYFEKKEFF